MVQSKEIPIIFSVNDTYLPFLDVSLRSLIDNASKDYKYRIFILNTGLNQDKANKLKELEDDNFSINFMDISAHIANIYNQLKDVFYFSLAAYYRLFAGSLFPQYSKILYLDCDTVILGDISQLYNIDLGDNILGGILDYAVRSTPEFQKYVKEAVSVAPDKYINSGILVINLEKFRENKIEEKFINLIQNYNFEVVDPDQAYLNFLCKDKIKYLPNGWNKTAAAKILEGNLNIVHYALCDKPWQSDDVPNGEYFWQYAKYSTFYDEIIQIRQNQTEEDRLKRQAGSIKLMERCIEIAESNVNFYKSLVVGTNNGTVAI